MSEFHPIQTLQPWLERAWMDRYLARELTVPESDWWEAYILAHPHLAEELEADETVRQEVRQAGKALTQSSGAAPRFTWQQIAATALILVLTAAALPQYLRKPPDVMPVDVYTLNTERSGGEPEWIVEDNGGGESEWVVVNIPNEPGSSKIWIDGRATPVKQGAPFISILVRRGNYRIVVDGEAKQTEAWLSSPR